MEHNNILTISYESFITGNISAIRDVVKQNIDYSNTIFDFDLGRALELNNSLPIDSEKRADSIEKMLNMATYLVEVFFKLKDYKINIIGAYYLTDKQILDLERSSIDNFTIDNMTLNDKEIIRRYKRIYLESSNDPEKQLVRVWHR